MNEPNLPLPPELADALAEALFRAERPDDAAIRALIVAHPEWAAALRREALAGGWIDGEAEAARRRIGPYRLLRRLGQGGFGEVHLAEGRAGRGDRVAIKVLREGMEEPALKARFRREAELLASLQHPHVAAVRDFGEEEAGRAWLAMEFVDGLPILEHARARELDLPQRLQLFLGACAGVAHAHQRAILHRDLSPANILVAEIDGLAVPKIIDFGLAKSLAEGDRATTAIVTAPLQRFGTLAYMAPEQLKLPTGPEDRNRVDTRADVYALGAILYELIAGRPVFSLRAGEGSQDLERRILEEEPLPPTLQENREASPTDLDWIALKALEKDPERRYASVRELARDIERSLSDEPIEARAPSRRDRLRRFARKHKKGVLIAASLGLAIVLGTTGTAIGFLRAREQAAQNAAQAASLSKANSELARLNEALAGEVRAAEEARSDALELAEFQRERLGAIDPEAFGRAMEAALSEIPADPRARRAHFTTVARDLLRTEVLDPIGVAIREAALARPLLRVLLHQSLSLLYQDFDALEAGLTEVQVALTALRSVADAPAALRFALDGLQLSFLRSMGRTEEVRQALAQLSAEEGALLSLKDPAIVSVFCELGRAADTLGEHRSAHRSFLQAVDAAKELGPTGKETLRFAQECLARHLLHAGRLREARELLEAVGQSAEFAARMPRRRADHLRDWIALHHREGDFAAAARVAAEVVQLCEQHYGSKHSQTFDAKLLQALALVDGLQSEAARAILLPLRGVAATELPADHPLVIEIAALIGQSYLKQRTFAEAEPYTEEVLSLRLRTTGPDSPQTISAMSDHAQVLWRIGRLAEAKDLAKKALERQLELTGEDHPETVTMRTNLGLILSALAEHQNAIEQGRLAHEGARRLYPPLHPMALSAVGNHAAVLRAAGESTAALVIYRDLIQRFEDAGQPAHLRRLVSELRAAECELALEQPGAAAERLERALKLLREHGVQNPRLEADLEKMLASARERLP